MPKFLRNLDWVLFAATFLLVTLGLVALWSLSPGHFFLRQLVWILIGTAALLFFTFFDYRIFANHGGALFAVFASAVLLLAAFYFFGPKTRGVARWFWFGSVAVEPVEFVKLLLILILAKYFSRRHIEIYQIRHLFISGFYAFLPAFFVMLQPALGSALILVALWVFFIIFSGIRFRHLAITFMGFAVLALVAWYGVLAPYQKGRIITFLDPYRDPQGAGYNAIQAMITVGSGQTLGKGIGYGTQSHLNFLPEAETDFIFAAFSEETGFLGVMILFSFFIFFLYRVLKVGLNARDNFSKLFVLGFAALVFLQAMVHIGMNMGLMPVTGTTLPFISYGGSSLVTLMAGVGILQSIRINSRSDIMDLA
ncbi:MAG: rod shape-determining protein RodA [bacterium]|nr:rod shape-determining protein RodA [bacterium]